MSEDMYSPCSTCAVDRLQSTLNEHGQCPLCVEDKVPPPKEPSKYAEIIVKPRKEHPRPSQNREDTASSPNILPYTPPQFDETSARANPTKELAMRQLCRRRFLPFVQRFRPKYMAGWVHEDICRRLERFVRDVEEGREPRMLLMMPPRSGKSELGSRHFPPWVLGQHPEWEIIAASHTSSLTLSFSRYIRDLIRDPAYQVVFPDMRLDPSSQSVENWNTLAGGGYLAAGVGTGITGRGAHILLLDDLVKDIEAADSVTIKENTWEWYGSTAYTRLAPGGGVLGIMTWWNEDDWAGRIQQVMASGEGDKFEVVRYPAINDEGDEYLLADDSIVQLPPGSDIPAGARMTRPMGTAIHPARYTTEAMLRIKRNLVGSGQRRVWNALYQQNPTPDDGVIFSKDMIQYFTTPPMKHKVLTYQAWDFAITESQQSDYTVCCTVQQDEHNNLYIVDVFRFRSDDGNAVVEHMIDKIVEHQPNFLGVEDGQIWKALKSQFETRCVERQVYQSYEVLQPLTDKIVRAGPLRGRMQLKKVFIQKDARWTEQFVKELMVFPGGKHDDQVDAASWATRLTLNHQPPRPPAPKKEKSWKDKLAAIAGGTEGSSHMSA